MLKRNSITAFLVFFSFTLWGQGKIENVRTAEHQYIKGTKVSLIPPQGFTEGLHFFGLQQTESSSSIMVLDIPGPYAETSKGITKESMLSKGVEVQKIKNLTINGLPATFVTGTQNANGLIYTKYILIFGTDLETIMINGVFPENLNKTGEKIKKSMLSVYYESDKKIDPFDVLDYTIDVSETKLKFGKSLSGSLIFSVDGQVPSVSSDKTSLIVAKSFAEITFEDKQLFCLKRLQQTSFEIESIAYTNEITIDGISGYEILAQGKNTKSGESENIYQVILFSDKLYYIFFGMTNDMTGNSIDEIKKVAQTFKRK